MKKVWLKILAFFILIKEATKPIIKPIANAFVVLIIINNVVRYLQFIFIHPHINPPDNLTDFLYMFISKDFVLMFLSSFVIRYLLILTYDFLKIDWFMIEKLKEGLDKKAHDENKLTRKITRYKKLGRVFLFIGLAFADPIFMAIYYREGYRKWNNIPNLKVLLYYTFSCIICSASSKLLFWILTLTKIGSYLY